MYARYINYIAPGNTINYYRSFEGSMYAIVESYAIEEMYDLILIGYYLAEHEYNSNENIKHNYGELFETCLKCGKYPAKIVIIDGDTMLETNKHYEEIKSIICGGTWNG